MTVPTNVTPFREMEQEAFDGDGRKAVGNENTIPQLRIHFMVKCIIISHVDDVT